VDGDVFHIVVSWPEGTHPDQDHQAKAVRQVLKDVGLGNAQAVLAAHNDNGFTHVHAMVNLVNPEDGKHFKMPYSKTKAQAWADEYSRQNGDTTCPQRGENARKRAENRQAHDQARESGAPSPDLKLTRDDRSLSRAEYERMRTARDAFFVRQAAERDALKSSHSQDWQTAKANLAAYARAFRDEHATAKAADKEVNRPQWREVMRRQEIERAQALAIAARTQVEARLAADAARKAAKAARAAEKREGTLLGKVALILGAQSAQEAQERQAKAIGAAKAAAARHQAAEAAKSALPGRQDQERRDLGKMLRETTFQKAGAAVGIERLDLSPMKARHAAEAEALRERQNVERREAGLPIYERKARDQDNQAAREQRPRDRQSADRPRDREKAPSPFSRAAAPPKDQAEQDRRQRDKQRAADDRSAKKATARAERRSGPEPQAMGKPPRPRFGPASPEQLAKRRERNARDRDRSRDRDDFDRER
jgi:hypothetical protein